MYPYKNKFTHGNLMNLLYQSSNIHFDEAIHEYLHEIYTYYGLWLLSLIINTSIWHLLYFNNSIRQSDLFGLKYKISWFLYIHNTIIANMV